MDLYEIKKHIEALYYQHCIGQGKLPLPDLVYYHWDKKRINETLGVSRKKHKVRSVNGNVQVSGRSFQSSKRKSKRV